LWQAAFFVFQISAQEKYMFHRFGLADGSYESLQSMRLETDSNQFFMVGLTADSLTSSWNLVSLKVNKDSITALKRLFSIDSNMILGAQGTAFAHNGKYVGGGLVSFQEQIAAAIFKYDPNSGDTVFCKYLEKDSMTRFRQGKLAHGGNYIFRGNIAMPCSLKSMKTDPLNGRRLGAVILMIVTGMWM
tara:strand:+ start:256 stop:819 length:564 start_codon:yes stop_codon:yes gene_type:complete